MCVISPSYIRTSIKHVVNSFNFNWDIFILLNNNKKASVVTFLIKVYKFYVIIHAI
ncbi:hypothetical protein AC48_0533 [Escherichia coli 2-427-07_S3_C3]|nr:hypothetical protein AC48_0533 [Escherichia coli 2-427-07_S3_C3]